MVLQVRFICTTCFHTRQCLHIKIFESIIHVHPSNPRFIMAESGNSKRTSYIDWDEYFMAIAILSAQRSKDPRTQVGACIVNNDYKIVGIGYNGMPMGCSDDEFPWGDGPQSTYGAKYLYVCHAEVNAVLNKNASDVKNCTIYVALFPCNQCAKVIIQSGITAVIYMSDKYAHKIETKAAKRMFDASGVKYSQYIPKNKKIEINFEDINWTEMNQLPQTPKKELKD